MSRSPPVGKSKALHPLAPSPAGEGKRLTAEDCAPLLQVLGQLVRQPRIVAKGGALDAGIGEIDIAEVGLFQIRFLQVSAAQICQGQTGFVQIGMTEVGAA